MHWLNAVDIGSAYDQCGSTSLIQRVGSGSAFYKHGSAHCLWKRVYRHTYILCLRSRSSTPGRWLCWARWRTASTTTSSPSTQSHSAPVYPTPHGQGIVPILRFKYIDLSRIFNEMTSVLLISLIYLYLYLSFSFSLFITFPLFYHC